MILVIGHQLPLGQMVVSQLKEQNIEHKTLQSSLDDLAGMMAECEGVTKLFVVTEPFHEQQMVRDNRAMEAAHKRKVKHIVRVSVAPWGATPESRASSEWLTERWAVDHYHVNSGRMAPAYTLLRPYSIAQDLVEDGAIRVAAGQGKVAAIDRSDVAAVVVACLQSDEHKNKAYVLTGSNSLTLADLAKRMEVGYRPASPFARLFQGMLGQPTEPKQAFAAVQASALSGGAESAVNGTVEEILGRKPKGF